MGPEFPTVAWKDEDVTFLTDCHDRLEPLVVVLVWTPGGFALADIRNRGWCTPSGRVEAGESHAQAAVRETHEETGIELQDVWPLGCFQFRGVDGTRLVPAYLGMAEAIGMPSAHDSCGAEIVQRADLPGRYYRWDSLLEAVFAFAESVANSHACPESATCHADRQRP